MPPARLITSSRVPRHLTPCSSWDGGIRFDDFTTRGSRGTLHSNRRVDTPSSRLYAWGSVCRDICRANTMRKRKLGDMDGLSTVTFNAGLNYIALRSPPVFVQENAYNKQALAVMLSRCKSLLPHYAVKVFIVEALTFKQRAARLRMYLIGINFMHAQLERPLAFGETCFSSSLRQRPTLRKRTLLYPAVILI